MTLEVAVDDRRVSFRDPDTLLDRPVFIIGCNRSGTTLLFRNLSENAVAWSLYTEAKPIFHTLWPIHPVRGDQVHRCASADEAAALRRRLYRDAHNKEYWTHHPVLKFVPRKIWQKPTNFLYKSPPIRFVEKTPSNCFRVPLLSSLWPDARFVFIVRAPEPTISSLMEGWKRWKGYADGRVTKWTYLAPPGWADRVDRPLSEIAAWQWRESNRAAWNSLRDSGCNYITVRHEDLLDDPISEYGAILDFLDFPWTERFESVLRQIEDRVWTNRGSEPERGKWKRLHYDEVQDTREIWAPFKKSLWEK